MSIPSVRIRIKSITELDLAEGRRTTTSLSEPP